MVRIRLRRVGGKKQASFRIVAADKESPRDGRFIEILGFYNPRTEPATIELKEDRIYDWMSKGAQPSDSAMQIFKTIGLTERYERFKNGEDVEGLVDEAVAENAARNVSPKTRHPIPVGKPKKAEKAAPVKEAPKAKEEEAEAKAEKVEEKSEKKETKTDEKADVKAEEKEDAKKEDKKAEVKVEKAEAEAEKKEPKVEKKSDSKAEKAEADTKEESASKDEEKAEEKDAKDSK